MIHMLKQLRRLPNSPRPPNTKLSLMPNDAVCLHPALAHPVRDFPPQNHSFAWARLRHIFNCLILRLEWWAHWTLRGLVPLLLLLRLRLRLALLQMLSFSLINARLPPFGIWKLSPKTSTEPHIHSGTLASGFICRRWNISPPVAPAPLSQSHSSSSNNTHHPLTRIWTRHCHHQQCSRQIMGQYFRLMLMFSQKFSHCTKEAATSPSHFPFAAPPPH